VRPFSEAYSPDVVGRKSRVGMVRRQTFQLPVMIAATAACLVAIVAVSQKANSAFPGKKGTIAYAGYDGPFPEGDSLSEVDRSGSPLR
jgi:hypothetical protein